MDIIRFFKSSATERKEYIIKFIVIFVVAM